MNHRRGLPPRLTFKPTYPHVVSDLPDWLVYAPTRRRLANPKRAFLVHKDVSQILSGPHGGFPGAVGAAFITTFVMGGYVTASLIGDPGGLRPQMERLIDLDEVWVACFREPKFNQWRLMGRFARTNVFIGLTLHRRTDLAGDKYAVKANDFLNRWATLLPNCPIIRGTYLGESLTKPTRDVDATVL